MEMKLAPVGSGKLVKENKFSDTAIKKKRQKRPKRKNHKQQNLPQSEQDQKTAIIFHKCLAILNKPKQLNSPHISFSSFKTLSASVCNCKRYSGRQRLFL